MQDELGWVIGESNRVLGMGDVLYKRPLSLAEIPLNYRLNGLESLGANAEPFALAYFDCTQAHFLLKNVVTLAIGARVTGRPELLDHCIAVLRETITHVPLQRPGYTLSTASQQLPEGGDGVWLATAHGIRGIIDVLDILGDRVPGDLRASLRRMLRAEVHRIVDDWNTMRPWFVKTGSSNSNQWLEPSAALVVACLFLGDQQLSSAYDLGVENLLQTIAHQGDDGAWHEGLAYGASSMDSVFVALSAMSRCGDNRLNSLPYRLNAWKWLFQMHLPGGNLVNYSDCNMSHLPGWQTKSPFNSLGYASIYSSDSSSLPKLKAIFPNGTDMGPGVMYAAAISNVEAADVASIENWSYFPSAALTIWRSGWQTMDAANDRSLAIWVKGSTPSEIHAHRDQGQVSIYRGQEPILLDCGVTNYGDPLYQSHFVAAAGHGILQAGALAPSGRGVDAPMSVSSLGRDGGSVSIDLTKGYSGVTSCTRRVTWSKSGEFQLVDAVSFHAPIASGTEIFRFHTGSADSLAISGEGPSWMATWGGVEMRIHANQPVTVEQLTWPDAVRAPFEHQVVIIRSVAPVSSIEVSTGILVAP
jgi:hypothetical protein